MTTLFTREVSPLLSECELTHAPRDVIDVDLAKVQHQGYEEALRRAGARVVRVDAAPELPDSVFVEDVALVLPEVAVILRPGAASRRGEAPSVARALGSHRVLREIRAPGTVDGGDILRIRSTLFVGSSSRTNADGIDQLSEIVAHFGYRVVAVGVVDCLHLKSAVTQVGPEQLLANRGWLSELPFEGMEVIDVDPTEAAGGNALWINDHVIYPASFPATADRLRHRGIRVDAVDVSEIQKAEGGVTCCCIPVWNRSPKG